MNLLERVLTLVRANLNTMVEKADDPEKVLKQLQLDMRNQLVQVKTQVATAIAESHKLQNRCKEKTAEAEVWMRKAEQAIQQNNDEAARTALLHYNDIIKLVQRYQYQQKEQDELVVTMRRALRQLEAKLSEVETTIDLLVARKRNALLQQRVYDTLSKTSSPKDKERAVRAQDAVLEAEARARALADLHRSDPDVQLDQLSAEQVVEQQLQELKAKNRSRPERPLLHEAKPQPSPLLQPQPQEGEPAKKRAAEPEEARQNEQAASSSTAKQGDVEQLKKLLEYPDS